MPTTTPTTTSGKITKRRAALPALPRKNLKPYTRKELAAEVLDLSGEVHDPAYLADLANGARTNHRLAKTIARAVRNLESRGKHGSQDKSSSLNAKA